MPASEGARGGEPETGLFRKPAILAGLLFLLASLSLGADPFLLPLHEEERPPTPVSGYESLSDELKEMQDDDFSNPGMMMVDLGRELFHQPRFSGDSCATCHGENGERLDRGRIAAYPVWDEEEGAPVNLQMRINLCLERHMDEFRLPYNHTDLLALETFVRYLARGEKVHVSIEGPMREHWERGRRIFHTRSGQYGFACVHCHEYYVGLRLRSLELTQAQTNGFPSYLLRSGKILNLHQKFVGCYQNLRAEPYEPGSPELLDLEIYLGWRGNGLPIETPAVRP